MSDNSKIEWTDATWNPVTGCTKVSPGCDHCYAERVTERFHGPGSFARVQLHPSRLDQPLRWRTPRRVFVNSMSDLFHDDIPDKYIAEVFAVMHYAPQHTFQVLTKRHGRMRSLMNSDDFFQLVWDTAETMDIDGHLCKGFPPDNWPLPNVWLGVSVENQQWADLRIPALLETPAAVHWISAEPLLGPLDLSRWMAPVDFPECWDDHAPSDECSRCIHPTWVVAGGESGRGARPMHPDWARGLRDQCAAAGVLFFFKQFGEYGELPTRPADRGVSVANDGTVYQPGELSWPDGPRVGEAIRARHDKAHLHQMYRVGKKAAGRELDGRTWDEYPAVTP